MNYMTSLTPDRELARKKGTEPRLLTFYWESVTNERDALRTLGKLIEGERAPSCPGRYYDLRDLFHALREGQKENTMRRAYVLGCLGESRGIGFLGMVVPFLDEYFSTYRSHKTAALLEFNPREKRDVAVRLLEEFSEALETSEAAPSLLLRPKTKMLVSYGCETSVHPLRDADL